MTETATNYNVDAIASELTELEQLNLKVAAIAGWTNIEVWQPDRNLPIKTFQGENKAHSEIGEFVPDYTKDLNAIVSAIESFGLDWNIGKDCNAYSYQKAEDGECLLSADVYADTPAIALCKLLLELNPKPETKPEVIEATFG